MPKIGRFLRSMSTNSIKRRGVESRARPGSWSNWRDLSDVEETGDRAFLIKIGVEAATNAINENKALNIPVTFMEGGWVVRRMPQGDIEKIARINHERHTRATKLTKGMVLHVPKSS